MQAKVIKWLMKWLPEIIFVVLLAVLVGVVYHSGFKAAHAEQQTVIDQMKLDAAEEKAAAAKAYAEKLEQIRQLDAEVNRIKGEVEQNALNMKADVERRKIKNKQGIENAIAQDKQAAACIDGLGANGLRQYRDALGYDN